MKIVGVLILILLILGVADYCLPLDFWLRDYIRGAFTETIGIIITLIFVERIISVQRKRDEESEEIKQLKRLDKILGIELNKFVQYASCMTQKPQPEDSIDYRITKDFDFNRLSIFHMPSLSVFDGVDKAYELMSRTIDNIQITIREALINYDFKYFPKIEKFLLKYLDFLKVGTPFGTLRMLEHNKDIQKMLSDMIKEIPNGKVPTYEEYPHNIMGAIIQLYHIINFHIIFSEEYSAEISKILTPGGVSRSGDSAALTRWNKPRMTKQ